jgi:hypothetical protein
MNSLPYDIVILPADELAQKAIGLSKRLVEYGTLFTLEEGRYYPHASLYMTQLKVADLEEVKALLADIATRTPQLDLTAARYDQAEGYIDADYARTETLDRLQMAVVEAINPIRDGMREKDKARMLTTTGKIRENLEKYGYRGVGELFRPHMTFARFADGQPIDTSVLPNPSGFSGQFVKLGLFEMGDNGTCIRKIAEFNLGI